MHLCLGLRCERPAAVPNAIALTDGGTALSYAALHELVAAEAAALRRDGVGPGSLVPLPAGEGRTVPALVSLLAILAAGAAFTPALPPALPPEPAPTARRPDSASAVRELACGGAWPAHLSPHSAPAYVLATSGSTGPAKHTVVTRDGLRQVFAGLYARLRDELPPLAVWTQLHPLTFGFSICEILGSLTFGGTLVLVGREDPVTFTALSRTLREEPAPHVVCLTPSELSVLMSADDAPLPTHLVLSGEPAHRAPLRDLFVRFVRAGGTPPVVVNTYAATETSGQITADVVTADRLDAVLAGHVGRPLPGVDVVLLGRDGVPVPPGDTGAEGEIEVRGGTVAAGYVHTAAHAEKFGTAGPERAFRTGDRGRWAGDGGLVVTERAERKVKLAGRWTALGDIERALVADGLAGEAVAAVEEYVVDGASAGRLLVAAVPTGASRADAAARIRRRVVRLLDGPVTVRLVVCEAIPRTAHGKTDLAALRHTRPAAPRDSGLAGTVLRVWTELLGAGCSADANLFESGVDSLGVVAAAVRLSEALGREVSPTFLLDHPRITLLTEALSDGADRTEPAQPQPQSPQLPPVQSANPPGSAADRRRAARRPAGAPPPSPSVSPPTDTEGAMQ